MRHLPPLLAREARVRREYAHLYEELDVRNWVPAAKVVDWLRPVSDGPEHTDARPRILSEEQFEFRGGAPRRPGLRARTRRSD